MSVRPLVLLLALGALVACGDSGTTPTPGGDDDPVDAQGPGPSTAEPDADADVGEVAGEVDADGGAAAGQDADAEVGPEAPDADADAGGGGGGGADVAGFEDCPPDDAVVDPSTSGKPDLDLACPQNRWIGLPTQGKCPPPEGREGDHWELSTLFADPANHERLAAYVTTQLELDPESMPGLLGDALVRRCVYTWSGDAELAPDISLLPSDGAVAGTDWLDPDCTVVVPLASSVQEQVWTLLRDHFMAAAGLPSAPVTAVPTEPPTRLAIVDDRRSLTGDGGAPVVEKDAECRPVNSPHGLAVRRLAQELTASTPEGGAVRLSVHRALDLVRSPAGPVQTKDAGDFGYHSRLAEAIVESVLTWLNVDIATGTTSAKEERLIINLSIGWEPFYDAPADGSGDALSEGVQAVRDAIVFAACQGALVVAAAGNDSGGPVTAGPMLPGGFASTLKIPGGCAGTAGAPAIYAVGGVDAADRDIVITREDARPILVAPAHQAGVNTGSGCGALEGTSVQTALTGTSVASIVTSSVAALLWHLEPDQDAGAVIEAIYDAGVPVPPAADFCATGTPCPQVKRVSVCTALVAAGAIAAPAGGCPTAKTNPAPPPPWAGTAGTFLDAPAVSAVDGTGLTQLAPAPPLCGGTFIRAGCDTFPGDPCPASQYYGAGVVPFEVDPQPGGNPCPACEILLVDDTSFNLVMPIEDGLDVTILGAFTVVRDAAGASLSWPLFETVTTVDAGVTYRVLLRHPASFVPVEGFVEFQVQASPTGPPRSAISPLTVGPQ